MEINSAITITVGTAPIELTNSGQLASGGKFPRGIVLVQRSADSGTIHVRHDGDATTGYPPVPKGEFSVGLPIGIECLPDGVSVVASTAGQSLYVYPL